MPREVLNLLPKLRLRRRSLPVDAMGVRSSRDLYQPGLLPSRIISFSSVGNLKEYSQVD